MTGLSPVRLAPCLAHISRQPQKKRLRPPLHNKHQKGFLRYDIFQFDIFTRFPAAVPADLLSRAAAGQKSRPAVGEPAVLRLGRTGLRRADDLFDPARLHLRPRRRALPRARGVRAERSRLATQDRAASALARCRRIASRPAKPCGTAQPAAQGAHPAADLALRQSRPALRLQIQ